MPRVVCAHVGPPLCCKGVGAVGDLDHGEGAGEGECGADDARVGCVAAAEAAVGVDVPHVAGAVGLRGAEPPEGGRAVQFRNTLVVGGRAGPRLKVGQLRAVHWEGADVAGRPAYFVTSQ